jgi:hypothetical protein
MQADGPALHALLASRRQVHQPWRTRLHWDVEVTDTADDSGPLMTQAYCSALPEAYGRPPRWAWEPLAWLALEAAYEATLLAGMINVRRGSSPRVLLTQKGDGASGSEAAWIDDAIERALRCVAGQGRGSIS